MADRYLGALKKAERERTKEMSLLFDADESLDRLTEAMSGEVMSVNDYLKLLSLNYQKYERRHSHERGRRYILDRMGSVLEAKEKKHVQRYYPKLTDFEAPLDDSVRLFLEDHPSRWTGKGQAIMKRLLWADLLMYLFMLVLLVFGLKFSFLWAFLISIVLWAALLVYFRVRLVPDLLQEQLARGSEGLDPLVLRFEEQFVNVRGFLKS